MRYDFRNLYSVEGRLYSVVLVLMSFFSTGCTKESVEFSSIKKSALVEVNCIGHWKDEGKRELLVREVANEFEFLHQDIKVNLKFPEEVYFKGSAGDATEVGFIVKEITSKQPKWDIIRLKDYYSKVAVELNDPDWGKKYLVDFSEFPDFVANQQQFLFSDDYKSQNGGITIGPYNEGFFWALWYNKEVAKKIGLEIKQFGMTADDFISYFKAVYNYNKANNTNIVPYFEENGWITMNIVMTQLFLSCFDNINELKNTDYSPDKIKKLESVFKILEELSNYEPTYKDRSKVVWLQSERLVKGECLFYIQGSWMYNIWDNSNKKAVEIMVPAEMPSMHGTSPCYMGGYKACWAVPKNAPHKEAAIKLLKYWATNGIADKWVRYTKCPTGLKGVLVSSTFGLDTYENFEYNLSKKYGISMINPGDNRYILGYKNRDISFSVIDIIEKKKTAAQTIAEIKKQIKL